MGTKRTINPNDLGLLEIMDRFATEDQARRFLEDIRWAGGVFCPHCGNADQQRIYKIKANPAKKVRPGLYKCAECRKQFRVEVGTIFEKSKIPLRKWVLAWYLVCTSKNGVSALELQRSLKLGSYRTAWHMLHRIRYALKDPVFDGQFSGEVEADEAWIGGKINRKPKLRGRPRDENKTPIVALIERDSGKVRSFVVDRVTSENIKGILIEHVHPMAILNTDESNVYKFPTAYFAGHRRVHHSIDEYVRGPATTNAVEGYFGNLKRSIAGTYRQVSRQHLSKYLAEFEFRHNTRDLSDGERLIQGLPKVEGKRLMLKAPKTE